MGRTARRWLAATATAGALLTALPAAAAVPVNMAQRNMLRSIIDMPALNSFFPVTRIELVGPNVWRLTAGRCHIDVTLVEQRGHYPGRGLTPPRMEPRAGRRLCER